MSAFDPLRTLARVPDWACERLSNYVRGGGAMKNYHVLAAALLAAYASAGDTRAPGHRCDRTKSSRDMVRKFYQLALVERHPREAFGRYMAANFLDHKADLAEPTRDGISAYLEDMIKTSPAARWQIVRIVGERNMVALHARFTPAPDAAPYAIADFFRLKGCKIVEHWDVVATPPKQQRNPNSRF
jgi:predicted SnoaL-like aldol condensation-catalyzing enzyme